MQAVDIVGIDLGTTKSVIAVWEPKTADQGDPRVLPNREGEMITPSVVSIVPETGALLVGTPARARMTTAPETVIYSVKRFIGRTPDDYWVKEDRKRVTYEIGEDPIRGVVIRVAGREFTPPEVSAQVLSKLKEDAAAALGGSPITRAVISVPAYFNESQRRATYQAGKLAGLAVQRIIPEPTAAALAFGLGDTPETVAVYDLGGGTFDISILRVEAGLFRVKAISGDTHLGGDDFDNLVVGWMRDEFVAAHPDVRLPVDEDVRLRARLREAAKLAKVALTTANEYRIVLTDLAVAAGSSLGLDVALSRAKFEELIKGKMDQTLELVDKALNMAGYQADDLSQVLLVGGQTRTPIIKDALAKHLKCPVNDSVPPEEAVARGAAVLGGRLCGYLKGRVALWDANPLSLGIEMADGGMEVIIPQNAQIPTERWRKDFTNQKDGQKQIRFKVWQGERPLAAQNAYVGEVLLPLTTSRPAFGHRINVLFKIDQNGILTAAAQSADTDSKLIEVVFTPGTLSQAEVEARRSEADAHREEDEITRRLLELGREAAEIRSTVPSGDAGAELRGRLDEVDAAIAARNVEKAQKQINESRGNT
jgi:molecular chaperone DnaK